MKQKGLLGKGKSNSEGLYVESRRRSNNRKFDKNSDRSHKGRSKSRDHKSKSKLKANKDGKTTCFICGKEGHWKRECPQRNNRQHSPSDSVNTASSSRQPLVLTVSTQDNQNEWILDSGFSFHITPQRDVLFDFKEMNREKVLMANNTQCNIKGIGKIRIINSKRKEVVLTEVRYMPSMS